MRVFTVVSATVCIIISSFLTHALKSVLKHNCLEKSG